MVQGKEIAGEVVFLVFGRQARQHREGPIDLGQAHGLVGQLGLPSALVFFAGRGASLTALRRASVRMVPLLSIASIGVALLFEGAIRAAFLPGVTDLQYRVTLIAVPFLFTSMFGSAVLLGRQRIGTVNLLSLGGTVGSLTLLILLVAVAGLGVDGAVLAYLGVGIGSAAAAIAAVGAFAGEGSGSPLALRQLLGYGIRIVPGSIATFFGYRADVFLLGSILASPTAIGLYSLAVGFAELLFYIPDSIATAFFPRIAASDRTAADAFAPPVARQTVLLTALASLALIPCATVAIVVLLPAFSGSLPALLVITPGVVALSISKVLSGYVSGLGRPLPVGSIAMVSVGLNLVANLLLIPRWGIVGAAAASLLSYSANAALMVLVSSRFAKVPLRSLILPRPADLATLLTLTRTLIPRGLHGLGRGNAPAGRQGPDANG